MYGEAQVKMNGAGQPTITEGAEFVKSVTHVGGTNLMVVTLTDAYPKLVAHAVDVRDDGQTGIYATAGNFTNESSITVPPTPIVFTVGFFNGGGTALNNPTVICVLTLAFRDSNVTYGN